MVQVTHSGLRIFVTDNGDPLEIWLDSHLPAHSELVNLIRLHGGEISDRHDDPAVNLLILNPTSVDIFDRYCHPSWLPMSGRYRYQRLLKAGGIDESKHKVLLTESWIRLCVLTGKLLGEDMSWDGCRKGGPPCLKSIKRVIRSPAGRPKPLFLPQTADDLQPQSPTAPSPASSPRRSRRAENNDATVAYQQHQSPSDEEGSARDTPALFDAVDRNQYSTSSSKRRVLRSVVVGRNDPPLNVQTSRWQASGPEPPRILQGQRIYVDVSGRFGRRHTLQLIKDAGGQISSDILKATHALLSPVVQNLENERLELVKQCAAQKVWCVGYDWLEDSFEEGKLLTPSKYAYQGGFFASRITDGALDDMFRRAQADGLSSRAEVAEKMNAEHGVYPISTWKQLYTHWQKRTGRFARVNRQSLNPNLPPSERASQARMPSAQVEATAPTGSSSTAGSTLQRGSAAPTTRPPRLQSAVAAAQAKSHSPTLIGERLRILREAYPICMVPGGQYKDVAQHLARKYPEQTEGSWGRMFYAWRKLPDDRDYTNYRSIFRSYLPIVMQGRSVEEISKLLARAHRDFGHTASEWHVLFGDWLKKGERLDEQGPSASTPSTSQSSTPAPVQAAVAPPPDRPKFGKTELAKWFREEFNSSSWVAREVAQATQSITKFKLKSLEQYYDQWRMNAEKFKDLPIALRYTGMGADDSQEPDSSPATPAANAPSGPSKRKAKDAPSRAPPAKKGRSDFTEDEEARMAVYIAFRTPTVTEPLFGDWVDFAKDNKNRPVPDWVEHYRSYRARINDLVIKLGATVPGRRSNGTKRRSTRAGSSDSVEFVAVQEKTTRMEDVEIVDVEDSSDEDA